MTDRTLSGHRIVILEDDYYQAQDCKQLLEAAGAKVVAISATFPDLSALLEEGRIDAVLIDINLGHGLSFDFARELKARAIPFVFLTGYDAAMLPDDLAGSDYLTKPADAARIMAALASASRRAP
ncbi:response regulator [Erythrobacter sp. CCH5-A1]|jgi:DNA-binding response OmpR family regulator|uniref:response regulator n=1 Tax=Erythrobacter sp. CCH5-A1 TaxID=1768792 RepID=UPI00082A3A73|nr:response regulator [Erythrobacter sp. CCH5-A1]